MLTPDTPHVWIGCLGCYNGGNLVGDWTDADEADDFAEHFTSKVKVPRSHTLEQHEELWVMDLEGFYGFLDGECSPSTAQKVADMISTIERSGSYDIKAVAAWATVRDESLTKWDAPTQSEFEEVFCGEHESLKAYAYEMVGEIGWGGLETIPDSLMPYLDFDVIAEELRGDHTVANYDGTSYIFHDA